MKSLYKISQLADKFERKISLAQQSETLGITTLFFGDSPEKQQAFNTAIQDPKGPVYKVLADFYAKNEKPASFNLKVSIAPGKGAGWVLTVSPDILKPAISAALDAVFKRIVGGSMATIAAAASAKVKNLPASSGGQTLDDVGSLELS